MTYASHARVACRMLSFNVTVRKGDSLDNMAKSLGVPRAILLEANKGTFDALPA